MRRKVAVFAAAFTLALAFAMGSVASAGGCAPAAGQPTNGTGLLVNITHCNFGPTILHAPVDSTITWSNTDFLPHAVSGAGWTTNDYQMFNPGASVSYKFTQPGIYPYMCSLHPGMAGIIVVGDVAFPGPAPAPSAPLTQAAAVTTAPAPAVATATSPTPVELPIALALIVGAALGSIATARWPRRWRVALPSWSA
jgi:plastocyanin